MDCTETAARRDEKQVLGFAASYIRDFNQSLHEDDMTWKRYPHDSPFVLGIHLWPVDSHKGSVMRGFAGLFALSFWKGKLTTTTKTHKKTMEWPVKRYAVMLMWCLCNEDCGSTDDTFRSNYFIGYIQIPNTGCRYNAVNFLPNSHKIHHLARPLGRGMGFIVWVPTVIYTQPQSLELYMQYHVILNRVITAPDCIVLQR